ncbi:hypothetical protein [Mesorhizobium sp. INR15]|uniref:hypothetical protein n=1 Tax=Mesorhizobium sp. INR15 TaxID=2654248 RepID=UPI00189689AC|nr:hypothetical protein [Mesorhizobium sp. INR15]QPC91478.1 hypothetical protein GA829_13135 [Mesorhizobium sp. INR15]
MFEILRARRITILDFATANNYGSTAISFWKSGRTEPRITDLEVALSTLGLELKIVEKPNGKSLF